LLKVAIEEYRRASQHRNTEKREWNTRLRFAAQARATEGSDRDIERW
jgi:hypothetical protein